MASPLPWSVVINDLRSSQLFGVLAPAAVSLSGRYQNVLLLLNLTMIPYSSPSTFPVSRMPGG